MEILAAVVGALVGASVVALWLRRAPASETPELEAGSSIASLPGEQTDVALEAVMAASPAAILFYSGRGPIVYANDMARTLFAEGRSLEGQNFLSLLDAARPEIRSALLGSGDEFHNVSVDGVDETYHVARRDLELGGEVHTLLMISHLTHEVDRREIDILKKVIRVISHELNNSLGSFTSLLNSARFIADNPEHMHKLGTIFDTIGERTEHLTRFLAEYARLAKMPTPRPQVVEWAPLLGRLSDMYPEATVGAPPEEAGWFDPVPVEQMLINLMKNAHESGCEPRQVRLELASAEGGGADLMIVDGGPGFSEEARQNALLPFYTTKDTGSGMGLAFSHEVVRAHRGRIALRNGDNGGAEVLVWLPGKSVPGVGGISRSQAKLTLTQG